MKKKIIAGSALIVIPLALFIFANTPENNITPVEIKDEIKDVQNKSVTAVGASLWTQEEITGSETHIKEGIKKDKIKKNNLTAIDKYREELTDLGVTDLSQTDNDALTIRKKADKKSKITGYLADGAIMTVISKTDKWYRIKSGSIKGYVRAKYVVTDDAANDSIMENKNLSATIAKDNIHIFSSTNKDSTVVAMGYKNNDYPILGFSENQKYAFIERTATISGWVPISDINISISAPLAMTKEEFEDYQYELELEQQRLLESYLSMSISSTGNKLQDDIINLIAHNESGNYKAARNPITSGEKTITVGAWQWYGEKAHNMLRLICNADADKAMEILNNTFTGSKATKKAEKLLSDIVGNDNWESSEHIFTTEELIAIKELLGSDQGVSQQNDKIVSDIRAKIDVAISSYRLTNDGIVAYFCDMFWQNPTAARAVIEECIEHFESAKKFCEADNGLKYLHETAMNNNTFKPYAKRREFSYAYCKKLQP